MRHRLRGLHHHHHHHHHHHEEGDWRGRRSRRGRRRRPDGRHDLDGLIAHLEERQRDLEEATADLAAKIARLKQRRDARTATS